MEMECFSLLCLLCQTTTTLQYIKPACIHLFWFLILAKAAGCEVMYSSTGDVFSQSVIELLCLFTGAGFGGTFVSLTGYVMLLKMQLLSESNADNDNHPNPVPKVGDGYFVQSVTLSVSLHTDCLPWVRAIEYS